MLDDRHIGRFMDWLASKNVNGKELTRVTADDARKYRAYMTNVRKLSPDAVDENLEILSAYFGWMRDRGDIKRNPFETDNVDDVTPKSQTDRFKAWLKRLDAAIDEIDEESVED